VPLSALDQGFRAYGARLLTRAAPYDPVARTGDPDDTAHFILRPGIDFERPWLAIENDVAFQWPLGLQGFNLTTDPQVGIHHFIGDNKVVVDVIHTGDERITLAGSFPGDSAPDLVQSLREVVRRDGGERGKILFVPEIMTHAQRVQVMHSEFQRPQEGRGRDHTYSIDFAIVGIAGSTAKTGVATEPTVTTAQKKGSSARTVTSNGTYNTLRRIAQWKLGDSIKWRQIYDLNEKWFTSRSIPIAQVPDYRLPLGTRLYY
jgi:hypothetical protein